MSKALKTSDKKKGLAASNNASAFDGGEDAPKKKGGIKALIILIVLIILASGFLFASVYFNLGGVREIVINTVNLLDPEYAEHIRDKKDLDDKIADLEIEQGKLKEEEAKLVAFQESLLKREKELNETETNNTPVVLSELSPAKIAEAKALGKIYSSMDSTEAAEILSGLTTISDMAVIIYYMDKGSAANVLAAMKTSIASDITEVLLHN